MTADSEDAPTTKPRTQQEIRREVQAAIAEANYQVAGKMMSYQVLHKVLNLLTSCTVRSSLKRLC
jgi:hypothetical protein